MGDAKFCTPTPMKPSTNFSVIPQGVDVQNLVGIGSAITDLHMREKNMHQSVCLSISACSYRYSFGAVLPLNGSNNVFSQPLVLLGGHVNIAPQSPPRQSNPPPPKKTLIFGV